MLNALVPLLLPLALTTSPDPQQPPSYHPMRAYVTGYNTVPAQTDDTPCIAASGADICGRHDAVACPRRVGLGTVVEIRGTTYVCEDRLARKFDTRFDISCDKDTTCPVEVTGWATVKVYGRTSSLASADVAMPSTPAPGRRPHPIHAVVLHGGSARVHARPAVFLHAAPSGRHSRHLLHQARAAGAVES